MRTAFIEALFELAKADKRVTLLVGDLGFGVVTPLMEELPNQFVNMGVAEQDMTGVAVGMALSGKIVFTYSIANFPIIRCLEQVRNDVCFHNANVKIVSVGGGMTYGPLGFSHHATEDLAVSRALPNMVVVAPGDPVEASLVTHAAVNQAGPFYIRLGRAGEPQVHKGYDIDFRLGKAVTLRQGSDLTLISTGGVLLDAVAAADELANVGIQARVLSMHTVKPLDIEAVLEAARETGAVFTVEEHSVIGGLGSAVAEVLMEAGAAVKFKRIGIEGVFSSKVGSQEYLKAEYGIDSAGIRSAVQSTLTGVH